MKTSRFLFVRRTPLDICILIVGLCLVVSLWATSLPEKTIPQVEWVLLGIVLYYLMAWWSGSAESRLVLAGRGLALVGLGLGLFGFLIVDWDPTKLTFLPFDFLNRLPQLPGEQVNPNVMAGALVLIIPLILGLAIAQGSGTGRLERLGYGLLGLGLGGEVILTKSRGGFLGLMVGLVLVLAVHWRWKAALVLATLGLLSGLSFAPWIREQVWGGLDLNSDLQDHIVQNWEGRLDIWSRAVFLLEDFPLSGIGMGTFTETGDTLYPFFIDSPGKVNHAHNLFLQIGLDLGLIGLAGWLGSLLCAVGAVWSGLNWPRQHGLAVGLLGSFTALVVHGLLDATTWGTRPALLVWLLWGLAAGLWRARGEHV